MASYIPSIQDYIPQLQPFRPDLNFYSHILQTKQSQYDANHKQLSGVYGTLLNSPMIRDTNIEHRDQFFKAIDQNLKKISGMDLSLEQNVTAAQQIFKPLYEDKSIVKDMTYTKQAHNQIQRGESFRSGEQYWDAGMKKIQYQMEEFKNASDEDALNMQAPVFTPFQNLNEKVFKAAKDSGLNISVDHNEGGYIVTDSGGNLLLGEKGKQNGVLPNYLLGLFKDDPKIQDVVRTQTYVARKDFAKGHAVEFGSEDAAESVYVHQVISSQVPKIEHQIAQSKKVYDDLANKKAIIEAKIKKAGGVIPGSAEETSLATLNELLKSKPGVDKHNEEVLNSIKTAGNLQDIHQLRQRADDIVASGSFMDEINRAAEIYALGTQKSTRKEDPFKMAEFKSDLDLRNQKEKAKDDFAKWKDQQDYTERRMQQKLIQLGLDPSLAVGLDNKGLRELIEQRGGAAYNKPEDVEPIAPSGGAATLTTTQRNEKILNDVHEQFVGQAGEYVTSALRAMKNHYDTFKNSTSEESVHNKESLIKQMKDLTKDTDFDVYGFLEGSVNAADIQKTDKTVLARKYETLINIKDDVSRYTDWQEQLADKENLKQDLAKNRQVIAKLTALKIQGAMAATKSMLATSVTTQTSAADGEAKRLQIAVLVDANGNERDMATAAKLYANSASHLYTTSFNPAMQALPPYARAVADFVDKYPDLSKQYSDANITSFQGKYGVGNEGGTLGVEKGKQYNANIEYPQSEETKSATDIVNVIQKNAENKNVAFYSGTLTDPHKLVQDPAVKTFAQQYLALYSQELGKKTTPTSANFDLIAQASPEMKFGSDIAEPTNYYKITPNQLAAKQIEGKAFIPDKDYGFTVAIPSRLDESKFKQSAQLSPTDMLLNLEGQSLTIGDKKRGMLTINQGERGTYYVSGYLEGFDNNSGKEKQYPVSTQPLYGKIDGDEAWRQANEMLNHAYQNKQKFVQEHISKQK